MKNIYYSLIILGLLIWFPNGLYAQLVDDFGLKVSLTASNFYATDIKPKMSISDLSYHEGTLYSPSISVFAKKTQENSNYEFVIAYIQKGANKRYSTDSHTINGNLITTYITDETLSRYLQLETNIQPKYKIDNISIYGILGPTLNYLISTNLAHTDNELHQVSIGYGLGIGVELKKVKDKSIFAEVKYDGDFKSFRQTSFKWWNRVLRFSIGTYF